MIGKKVVAFVVVAGLTASVGLSSNVYAKVQGNKTNVKYSQAQMQKKQGFGKGQMDIKTRLDALVKAGTITQTLEDKVMTYLNQKKSDMQAEKDKLKAMTAEERKAYIKNNIKPQRTDMFSEMVKGGALTQSEADSLKAALPNQVKEFKAGMKANMKVDMKTKLDTLVKAGTITQTTEDQVIAYFNQQKTAEKAEMDKIKSMTKEERKAYFDSKVKEGKKDPLANLVTSGTLTQAQADAIKKLMRGHQMGHGKKGFRH